MWKPVYEGNPRSMLSSKGGVTRHFPEKLNENRGYYFTKITWYIDYLVNGNIVSTG